MCGGGPDKQEMTDAERRLKQVAWSEWQTQKELGAPIKEQFRDNVTAQNHKSFKGDVIRTASAGLQTQNAQQVGSGLKNATLGAGMDPTGTRFDSTSKALQQASALNQGNASTNALIDAETNAQMGNLAVVAVGQGQQAGTLQGFSQLAQRSFNDEARQTVQNFNNDNNKLNAATQIAGMGTSYAYDKFNTGSTTATDPGTQSAIAGKS